MGVGNVMQTARSGMNAAKAAISTSGHNITNSKTKGFSRQRAEIQANLPEDSVGNAGRVGTGAFLSKIDRINDQYLDKQLRNSTKDQAYMEEKDMILQQVEDVFNELDGEGLNRMISRFFNEFRRLANEPDRVALRQSVREASDSMVQNIRRMRGTIRDVTNQIDTRLEASVLELNNLTKQLRDVNLQIGRQSASGTPSADLLDTRERLVKEIAQYIDVTTHEDSDGYINVTLKGIGPLVTGPNAETFSLERSPADDQGKPENAYDLLTSSYAGHNITHSVKGGRIGALLEVRDQAIANLTTRLDDIAYSLTTSVNQIHRQGFTADGKQGQDYFRQLSTKSRAAEYMDLSNEVKADAKNIAAAAAKGAAGDNRIALAIASLQGARLMDEGQSTFDDFYNGMVSEVGVNRAENRASLDQQRNMVKQLSRMREQISGVSIDEETTNILQYQQIFDASAKVIQVADSMLDSIMSIMR